MTRIRSLAWPEICFFFVQQACYGKILVIIILNNVKASSFLKMLQSCAHESHFGDIIYLSVDPNVAGLPCRLENLPLVILALIYTNMDMCGKVRGLHLKPNSKLSLFSNSCRPNSSMGRSRNPFKAMRIRLTENVRGLLPYVHVDASDNARIASMTQR